MTMPSRDATPPRRVLPFALPHEHKPADLMTRKDLLP